MTTTVQIQSDMILINGNSLDQLIAEAVKTGVSEVLREQKKDPLETITVQDLATQYRCTVRTMDKRIAEANVKTVKTGKFKAIFRKDLEKIIKAK